MIEFTANQEVRSMRTDCRVWTEIMIERWYSSEYPQAVDYPADELVLDLQEVFFACCNDGVQNVAFISLLALLVLQAKGLNCSERDVQFMMEFFLIYAHLNKVHYAQIWIEYYLEEITRHAPQNS